MMISTESFLLKSELETPVERPLCQKPPSPMIEITRLSKLGAIPVELDRPRP